MSGSILPLKAVINPKFDFQAKLLYILYYLSGAVAQLVERFLGKEEVEGSNPFSSILFDKINNGLFAGIR